MIMRLPTECFAVKQICTFYKIKFGSTTLRFNNLVFYKKKSIYYTKRFLVLQNRRNRLIGSVKLHATRHYSVI